MPPLNFCIVQKAVPFTDATEVGVVTLKELFCLVIRENIEPTSTKMFFVTEFFSFFVLIGKVEFGLTLTRLLSSINLRAKRPFLPVLILSPLIRRVPRFALTDFPVFEFLTVTWPLALITIADGSAAKRELAKRMTRTSDRIFFKFFNKHRQQFYSSAYVIVSAMSSRSKTQNF